ncbi:MAG: hypothetical protein WBA88_11665 [Pseudaminobacter sp.]
MPFMSFSIGRQGHVGIDTAQVTACFGRLVDANAVEQTQFMDELFYPCCAEQVETEDDVDPPSRQEAMLRCAPMMVVAGSLVGSE